MNNSSSANVLVLAVLLAVSAQNVSAAPSVVAEPWHVTERAANSRVWESLELLTDPVTGTIIPQKHSYTELATGLHFSDPLTGQFTESEEKFTITPQGEALAAKGQYQLRLAANINSGGIGRPDHAEWPASAE